MLRIFFTTFLVPFSLLLAACGAEYQTTSGASYLSAARINDKTVAAAAAYEPNLRFPARIGVVRLVCGSISTASTEEKVLLQQSARRSMGAFTHLGRLEAQMVGVNHWRMDQQRIRQLAASRHLNYVLVISFDPKRNSDEALFMDVASGYPYASVETKAKGRGKTSFWGGEISNQQKLDAITLKLAKHLNPDLQAMLAVLDAKGRS